MNKDIQPWSSIEGPDFRAIWTLERCRDAVAFYQRDIRELAKRGLVNGTSEFFLSLFRARVAWWLDGSRTESDGQREVRG